MTEQLSLKKPGILRGFDEFRRVRFEGKRFEGRLLRCYFLPDTSFAETCRIGFRVPSRGVKAVFRNKLKRLMREAVRIEYNNLVDILQRRDLKAAIIISYKGPPNVMVQRLRLRDIHRDIVEFRRSVVANV